MTTDAIWGLVISGLALVFSALAFRRNSSNDEKQSAQQQGAVLTELGYIKSGVDDIKAEQREQRKINSEVSSKLSALETSTVRAHARLDRLEEHEDRQKKS